MYCFDTDVLSAVLRRDPPLHLIRRIADLRLEDQFTTAITLGELMYGAARRPGRNLLPRIRDLITSLVGILPFDEPAAEIYGGLKAHLEAEGRRLDEPDLRIASIALARDITLVSGNIRHFSRVPDLRVENWLSN